MSKYDTHHYRPTAMVGELSPDGNFFWNGTEWEPNQKAEIQPVIENIFQLETPNQESADWIPVLEKSEEGGKAKFVAMSIVGLLIITALSWLLYAFVIDLMLFPDDLTKDDFLSITNDTTNIEDVLSGDTEDWYCSIEYIMSEDLVVTTKYDYYVSKDSVKSISSLSMLGTDSVSEVWIDEKQIAWKLVDDEDESETGKVSITGMDSSPANELLNKAESEIDTCFIHHVVANLLTNDPSQKFTSGPERFPDEDGERAVKVVTELRIDELNENETFTVSVYFDEDDNLLGSKIENSTFDGTIILGSKSTSKPGWVKNADTDVPLLLSVDPSSIWISDSNSSISTQFNATYSMDGVEVVLYTTAYDDDYNAMYEIEYTIDMASAMDGGVMIQHTDDWGDDNNCTISYTDIEPLDEISTGDVISISCDSYAMSDYDLGLADSNGIAQEKDLVISWVSSFFTIIALLGAALIVSRRDS
jgi:hypothetical protein